MRVKNKDTVNLGRNSHKHMPHNASQSFTADSVLERCSYKKKKKKKTSIRLFVDVKLLYSLTYLEYKDRCHLETRGFL